MTNTRISFLTLAALALALGLGLANTVVAQAPFALTSPDISRGQPFADQFLADKWGCHGGNESPELQWSHPPAGTKSFAITWFDPFTPPQSGWWHWIVYDIPASAHSLPRKAGSAEGSLLPRGARQGHVDGDPSEARYFGPCPGEGDAPHGYTITVYALKVDHLDVTDKASASDIAGEILGKEIAHASLIHPFARAKQAAR